MTQADALALLPLAILGMAPVALMLVIAFYRNHAAAALIALGGLLLAFLSLPVASRLAPHAVAPLLIIDRYALFYMGLIIASSFFVTLLAYGYFRRQREQREEFYLLLLLATLGSAALAASSHFASFFLGLEILSISLVVMMAYLREREHSVEAGLKYLILAAASTSFLLFGMALVYAEVGTMELSGVARAAASGAPGPLLLAGLSLLIIGIGFKLALVPFHMWTPDVYQGAPVPATAFVATVSKGAVFALLLRTFSAIGVDRASPLMPIFSLIAIASMLAGNLLALRQNNVKRLLAYSSIAHLGYALVGFLAGGPLAAVAVTYYLVAYSVTILGAFGVVAVLSGEERDAEEIDNYRGLSGRHPWLAASFTAMLFSLAGIPLTAGFVGKFYLLAAGVRSDLWVLALTLVLGSAISLYYYLRVVVAISAAPTDVASPSASTPPCAAPALALSGGLALAALVLLLIWLGVYPAPLIHLIRQSMGAL